MFVSPWNGLACALMLSFIFLSWILSQCLLCLLASISSWCLFLSWISSWGINYCSLACSYYVGLCSYEREGGREGKYLEKGGFSTSIGTKKHPELTFRDAHTTISEDRNGSWIPLETQMQVFHINGHSLFTFKICETKRKNNNLSVLSFKNSINQSCIHPSIHSFIHPSIHSFIHPSIHPFSHSVIHWSIHPFIHPILANCLVLGLLLLVIGLPQFLMIYVIGIYFFDDILAN